MRYVPFGWIEFHRPVKYITKVLPSSQTSYRPTIRIFPNTRIGKRGRIPRIAHGTYRNGREVLATVPPVDLSPDRAGTMKAVTKRIFIRAQGETVGRKKEGISNATLCPANGSRRIVVCTGEVQIAFRGLVEKFVVDRN